MKRLFLFVLIVSAISFGQNIRYDSPYPSVSPSNAPYLVANLPPVAPVIHVCANPANFVPCTNYVTTFTAAGVACPNGAQDTPTAVPQPSACQSTGDAQGNIGFWAPAGKYDYTVCIGNSCFGPYTVTLTGAASGIPNPGANGIVVCTGTNCSSASTTTITGTANDITVTNGNGVAGAPTIDLPNTAVTPGSYTSANVTVDAKGRLTAASNGSGYPIQINGAGLTNGDTINFNGATPAAPTNGINITFATSNAAGVDRVSAAIVGDGNAAHCFLGTGVFGSCASAGVTGSGTGQKIPLWAGAGASTSLTDSTISFSGGTYTIAGSNSLTVGGNTNMLSKTNSYNGDAALVGNGLVSVTGITSLAGGKGANLASTSLYTVGGNNTGEMYRVSCYLVINQAATSSSTLPACVVSWTDLVTGGVLTNTFTSTSTANTVGTFAGASFPFWPQSATAINVSTTGYVSSGVTPMNYGYIFMLEKP